MLDRPDLAVQTVFCTSVSGISRTAGRLLRLRGRDWRAALLVPVLTTVGTGRKELDNFDFGLLEELVGIETLTTLIGEPATDPVYAVDAPASDDTSFEARRARALRALVHRASNPMS